MSRWSARPPTSHFYLRRTRERQSYSECVNAECAPGYVAREAPVSWAKTPSARWAKSGLGCATCPTSGRSFACLIAAANKLRKNFPADRIRSKRDKNCAEMRRAVQRCVKCVTLGIIATSSCSCQRKIFALASANRRFRSLSSSLMSFGWRSRRDQCRCRSPPIEFEQTNNGTIFDLWPAIELVVRF